MSDISNDDSAKREALANAKRIAVLGMKADGAAQYVPEYLSEQGYEVIGANPKLPVVGDLPVVASLGDVGPIDIVVVFRRSDALPMHLQEFIASEPRTVWFQEGIRNDDVAHALSEAGIDVVQDRCSMVEHRRLIGATT